MPPTPPPTVTSTDQHPLLLPDVNYPDARHYQPLPDSPTYPATPPPQQQPELRAKDDESSRFGFPLPPRAAQQTHDTTRRQTDGNTAPDHNNHDNDGGNDNDGSDPRKPIDSPPTLPAVTTSAAVANTIATDTAADPSAEIQPDQLAVGKTDDDYDISILKSAGLYRRSGTSGSRGSAPGLVHRGIGLVKRDTAGGYSRVGAIAASTTPGSGRLKEDELAGRYGALPWLLSIHSIPVALLCCPAHSPRTPPPPPRARFAAFPARLPSIQG